MCGIFGVVDKTKGKVPEHLRLMSDTIYHRGPDDQQWVVKTYRGTPVGFGMNRLAIIDVEQGKQPIANEDNSIHIVFNGEIYNYKDLKSTLEGCGHVFTTNSDTEVILHAYEQYGKSCVDKLRGMFAFCIVDEHKGQVFIARDHAGIKPLYYSTRGGRFVFASEIKAVSAVVGKLPLSPPAVASYFTYRYIPGPDTIWHGIKALPPGHHLTYDVRRKQLHVERWWSLPLQPVRDSYKAARLKLAHLIQDAVRVRLQSEVPLGAFLSGGVDSSLVCVAAKKYLQQPLNVYNIGYPDANEYQHALALSKQHGFDYTQVGMSYADVADLVDSAMHHMDQPLGDAASLPTLYLSRQVKKRLTVMLSGEGADELFAGYWQYDGILKQRQRKDVSRDAMLDHMRRSSYFLDQHGILTKAVQDRHDPISTASRYWTGHSLLQRMSVLDTQTWLPDDLLMKVDKMTMGASVEARVPFLDRAVMEYALRLPDSYKYGGTTKRILKDVAEDLGVPTSITRRPKMGFTVPTHTLLQGPLRNRFRDAISSSAFRGSGLLDVKRVDHIVDEYYRGADQYHLFCWVLFVYSVWVART